MFLSYVLSFIYVGIYWNNHHHLLPAAAGGQRRDAVGQPAPAVLAVADPVHHRLDGREPFPRRCRPRLYGGSLLMAALAWELMQA